MATGDDQRVPRIHGPDIEKRNRQLVLTDAGGANFP